jgi:hypothetical protein
MAIMNKDQKRLLESRFLATFANAYFQQVLEGINICHSHFST